jgi:hypothetical protein
VDVVDLFVELRAFFEHAHARYRILSVASFLLLRLLELDFFGPNTNIYTVIIYEHLDQTTDVFDENADSPAA